MTIGVERGHDLVGSERDVLLHYLTKMREAVVQASDGLTEDEQRTPGAPSGTNLLGLIHHLTAVEAHWFRRVSSARITTLTSRWTCPPKATRDEIVAAYRAACTRSDEIARACPDLSTMAEIANPGEDETVSLRRIVAHMIEEAARHAGHADILREQIDGATDQ